MVEQFRPGLSKTLVELNLNSRILPWHYVDAKETNLLLTRKFSVKNRLPFFIVSKRMSQ